MKENTTYITTATIRFYENLYLFPVSEKYFWIIKLEDCPLCSENNRIHLTLNDSYEDSKKSVDVLRNRLALNHIFDGSKATIILNSEGVVAIGTNGDDNYCDIKDNFVAKPFSALGINITSLVVANY